MFILLYKGIQNLGKHWHTYRILERSLTTQSNIVVGNKNQVGAIFTFNKRKGGGANMPDKNKNNVRMSD